MAAGTMTAPAGFTGPAAFPFAPPLPNDAPPVTRQPYLVAQGTAPQATGNSITIPVQTATAPGDLIIVAASAGTSAMFATAISDTQGNVYVSAVNDQGSGHTGLAICQNPKPLTTSDTVKYVFSGGSSIKNLVVAAVPLTAFPGVTAGAFLTFDTAIGLASAYNTTGYTSLSKAVSQPEFLIAAFMNTLPSSQMPSIGQDWTPFATFVDPARTYGTLLAWKYVPAKQASTTLAWSLQGANGAQIWLVGLYPENRFAPVGPPLMPPGIQSPAAWQYQPAFNSPGTLLADEDVFTSTGSMALAPAAMSGAETETFTCTAEMTLPGLAMAGTGGNYEVNGAGSMTLGPLGMFGQYKPPQGVTGWDLYSTLQQQAAYAEYYKTTLPMACPNDGEPLREGPPSMSGVLYCPYDGFQYPRDWDAETMSGM